jgi:hypothetical protein
MKGGKDKDPEGLSTGTQSGVEAPGAARLQSVKRLQGAGEEMEGVVVVRGLGLLRAKPGQVAPGVLHPAGFGQGRHVSFILPK